LTVDTEDLGELDLPERLCRRHGRNHPCTCAMGNLYRFVEPVVLLLLKENGASYGYDLSSYLQSYALTDAEIERAALYRVLNRLEMNGNVTSAWDVKTGGPARRIYQLTAKGRTHLDEWATVLDHVSKSMALFVRKARQSHDSGSAPRRRDGVKSTRTSSLRPRNRRRPGE
jgi:PadR family transcriptional regulator, regulatory protein PadR